MDYRTIKLPDYGIDIEIGIVPNSELSRFLSRATVKSGAISKADWEKFLLSSLIKEQATIEKVLAATDNERDRTIFKHSLTELIYKFNNRLDPKHIVVANDTLLHISDALRGGVPTSIILLSNPGWFGSVEVNTLVDSKPARTIAEVVWERVKQDEDRNYVKEYVQLVDIEVPILEISSSDISAEAVVEDFVERRCNGDIAGARASSRMWAAHVITLVIPDADSFVYALIQGGYMNLYTENLLTTQLYLATLRVNPDLDWNLIDWSHYEDGVVTESDESCDKCKGQDPRLLSIVKQVKNRGRASQSSRVSQSPTKKFSELPPKVILGMKEKVKQRIVGQDKAVDALVDALTVARVGLRGDKRPVGSFLLAGTTGVGKTELAKVIADELGVPLHRIDCSEFQQAHETSKLIGAPPGYVGFEDINSKQGHGSTPPTTLMAKVKKKPFSVVLFDEIEKAHDAIFHILLQIMDEGHATSGRGETISFNQAIILLTSNIGSHEAAREGEQQTIGFGGAEVDKASQRFKTINKAIKDRFSPEFLNRLSEVIQFDELSPEVCCGIVDILLNKTKTNLTKAQNMDMDWGEDVKKFIVDIGFSNEYGARSLERIIQKNVELPLAVYLLEHKYLENKVEEPTEDTAKKLNFLPAQTSGQVTISLTVKKDAITFTEAIKNEKSNNDTKRLSSASNPNARRTTRQSPGKTPRNR